MAEEKRKRGRPRKNPEPVVEAAEKPVRRRGRPPKNRVQETAITPEKLVYKTENAWDNKSMSERQIEKFCKGYKAFWTRPRPKGNLCGSRGTGHSQWLYRS